MRVLRSAAALAALAATALALPALADHGDAETFLVTIRATVNPAGDFDPKIGLTTLRAVTFLNGDLTHHDLRFTRGLGEIGFVDAGEHVTVGVPPGEHPYVCVEHLWMHGVLVVR